MILYNAHNLNSLYRKEVYMTKELKPGIWWNGVFDRGLKTFDIIMTTEFGTTYNAYTVKGREKTALIETAKEPFKDEYFVELEEILGDSPVDYIIVNHTEPDHSGSLDILLDKYPDAVVYGSSSAIMFLKEIVNKPFNSHTVSDGETLSLGGRSIQFISAPNLHWPDTIYSYLKEDNMLFTCDSFGAHYGAEGILRSEIENEADYMKAAKYYFDKILGPFKPFMQKALAKIADLPIDMICTGHGPVLDTKIHEFMDIYKDWSRLPEKHEQKTAVIAYVSSYGYTKQIAWHIQKGLEAAGLSVRTFNLIEDDTKELDEALADADAILLGSPTMLSDALKPVYDLSSTMLPVTHGGKYATAFGSYGWSGEAVKNLCERLKQLRMKVTDGIRVRLKPDDAQLKSCFEFGKNFGETVKGKAD